MKLGDIARATLDCFRPPSAESVSEWAEKNRVLTSKSAEPGPWKNDRAPYQREIMDAYTEPGIWKIVVMSSAQVGKTDMVLNMIGRSVDLDPGPMLFVGPSDEYMEKFSKERLADNIAASPVLRRKVHEAKSRDGGNTLMNKSFPGGFLALTGANSPAGLAGRPIQKLFMDEVDRMPKSAGTEGDPVMLATERTVTFFNRKIVLTSTPTDKGASRIEKEFTHGTQEEWCVECEGCHTYHEIVFEDIRFEKEAAAQGDYSEWTVTDAKWRCPQCGHLMDELAVKRAPAKWIPRNPRARERGVRSFHLNAFMSPWGNWKEICKLFLDSKDDANLLKTFYNLQLGKSFELRTETGEPERLFERRETYPAEVPRGVLALTMGVDTQDNRLEYEVVGWGRSEESWGIRRGVIPGRADEEKTWQKLDELLDRVWILENGKGLKIAAAFIDSGGHYTEEIYNGCRARLNKRIFPIKGNNRDDGPLVRLSKTQKTTRRGLNLFIINVYAGKEAILYNTGVSEKGARYMHYPDNPEAGYDQEYFRGLISERRVLKPAKGRQAAQYVWEQTYTRNEPLDMRNYARAAFKCFDIDLRAAEERLWGEKKVTPGTPKGAPKKPRGRLSAGIKV